MMSLVIPSLTKNVHFDGWGNFAHVLFLKIIGGRDWVFKQIYMPKRNEFLGFNHTNIDIGGRLKSILR
jgi:hypothetical protein